MDLIDFIIQNNMSAVTKSKNGFKEQMVLIFEELFQHFYVDHGKPFEDIVAHVAELTDRPPNQIWTNLDEYLDRGHYVSFNRSNKTFMEIVDRFTDAFQDDNNVDIETLLENILTSTFFEKPMVYNDVLTAINNGEENKNTPYADSFYNISFDKPLNFSNNFILPEIIADGIAKYNLLSIKKDDNKKQSSKSRKL